uniref:peptidoglycan-binding domain-containing protein n=2 Tax=Frankia tisae TaxID=2950104 RepID=UPI0021BEA812
ATSLANCPTLKPGQRDPVAGRNCVAALQRALRTHGYPSQPITGAYLDQTRTNVVDFQGRRGITPASGTVGPQTRQALLGGPTTPGTNPSDRYVNSVTVIGTRPRLDPIICDNLSTQILIEATFGPARWKAVTTTTEPPAGHPLSVGPPAPGVTVQPAGGTLEKGESRTIQLSGAFTGDPRHFWLVVSSAAGWWSAQFACGKPPR